MMDTTLKYYQEHAEDFIDATIDVDMSSIYNRFLKHLPPNGYILDAGSGSGRDSRYFKEKGYRVKAIDYCPRFVEQTEAFAGVDSEVLSFQELNYCEEFDAIWACASLLHINSQELPDVLQRLFRALKTSGVFYMSFKYGDYEGDRQGRWFTDFNENSFQELTELLPDSQSMEMWITKDLRPTKHDHWLNILVKKASASIGMPVLSY